MTASIDTSEGAGLPVPDPAEMETQPTYPLSPELPNRNHPPITFRRSDWP